MELLISPHSEVFSELVKLNAWSLDLWLERSGLIDRKEWNMRSRNQAGNASTANWLKDFENARIAATRSRLDGPKSNWDDWSSKTESLLSPLRSLPDYPKYSIGSGENSDQMPKYELSFFLADIHLLLDADLSGEVFSEDVDLSEYIFPAALRAGGVRFAKALKAQGTHFGDHSSFDRSEFHGEVTFYNARFGSWNCFVMAEFHAKAVFENATFGHEGSFTATIFKNAPNFRNILFEGSAPFCGAVFEGTPDFSNAQFLGEADFVDATFANGALFDYAWFPERVFVNGLPKEIIEAIANADHSNTRPTH